MRKLSLSGVVFLSVLCGAEAATIEIKSGPGNVTLIRVSGTLKLGDEETFNDKIIKASSNGTVFLEGPGGNVFAATEIGTRIRLRGFQTVVSPNDRCASACALAWLGGRHRSVAPTGRVGFHAVYRSDDDKKRESGAGNALVGAYLRDLGLSSKAIVFITIKSPDEMNWLSAQDARENGIEVEPYESKLAWSPPEPELVPPPSTPPLLPRVDPPATGTVPLLPNIPSPPPKQAAPAQNDLPHLLDVEAASAVQERLRQLRFFWGVKDGIWGPRSRIALRDFKAHNDLPGTDEWTPDVHRLLIDSGWPAPIGYVSPSPDFKAAGIFVRFPPLPGTSLHPLNLDDAARMQRRLAELGYYPLPADGLWGMVSRNALREFKAARGLPMDDIWDGPTEHVLMRLPQ